MENAEGRCMKMSYRFVGPCTCIEEGYPDGACSSEMCYCSRWICHYI